ncbi:hypothetical protein Ade02nite_62150 [Paractinoplanes deccanensis]|uniref:Uncharacterized protein n=1 Tax=Paractinoplanes deccanensis TaxID=113561 RepID=A0ABQ3YC16_9ACTN|nr:hypothetical protein Ade02nite_62150 [Actinoplanes deccanensis]
MRWPGVAAGRGCALAGCGGGAGERAGPVWRRVADVRWFGCAAGPEMRARFCVWVWERVAGGGLVRVRTWGGPGRAGRKVEDGRQGGVRRPWARLLEAAPYALSWMVMA